jgi:hypothetical protein
MAQTGYTPIQLYRTTTAAAVPLTANLAPGELAINIANTDMALFAENASGTVVRLMNNPAGLKYPTADGTNGQVVTTNGSGTLTFSTPASGLTIGTTSITSGTSSRLLYDNAAVVGETSGITTNGTTLTLAGTTAALASVLTNAAEVATVSATAATGTINFDITTQSVLYYTSNASANWTVNFRASSGTSLNTAMSTGQCITVAFLVTQGATAYYNSAVQVDGSAVTPKYQGGSAWTAGNASSIDIYTYTIVKTGSAAFTVFTSQTQFK